MKSRSKVFGVAMTIGTSQYRVLYRQSVSKLDYFVNTKHKRNNTLSKRKDKQDIAKIFSPKRDNLLHWSTHKKLFVV